MAANKVQKKSIGVLGVDLSSLSESHQLLCLGSGALIFALAYSALQEKVFAVDGFKFGGFMTFVTSVAYVACAWFERSILGEGKRKGALKDYFILSFLTLLGLFFTNKSLDYINYPMRIIFKSAKVIPVMIIGVFALGRRYKKQDYANVMLLVASIVCFSFGDIMGAGKNSEVKFDWRGIALIGLGVVADAATANFEELKFFRNKNCSHAEIMFYAYGLGAVWSFASLFLDGEWFVAVAHAQEHPEVVPLIVLFSVLGYYSVSFVLQIIKHFGATNAEICKSIRKVTSIALSFVLFPDKKVLTHLHIIGGVLFCITVLWTIQMKSAKHKQKK